MRFITDSLQSWGWLASLHIYIYSDNIYRVLRKSPDVKLIISLILVTINSKLFYSTFIYKHHVQPLKEIGCSGHQHFGQYCLKSCWNSRFQIIDICIISISYTLFLTCPHTKYSQGVKFGNLRDHWILTSTGFLRWSIDLGNINPAILLQLATSVGEICVLWIQIEMIHLTYWMQAITYFGTVVNRHHHHQDDDATKKKGDDITKKKGDDITKKKGSITPKVFDKFSGTWGWFLNFSYFVWTFLCTLERLFSLMYQVKLCN